MPRYRYDDEDDDRPRRRRRDNEPRGVPTSLIVGGVVGGVLLVVAVVAVVAFSGRRRDDAPAVVPQVDAAPKATPALKVMPAPSAEPDALPAFGTPLPAGMPPVRGLAFAGGEDGVVAVLGSPPTFKGEVITVARTKTGEKIGTVPVDERDAAHGYAVGPTGKYAAVRGPDQGEGHPLTLWDVPTGTSYRFHPYSRKGGNYDVPQLVGFSFPAADRLLTVNERSGFDVWQLPGMRRLAGHPPRPPTAVPFLTTGGGYAPMNFAFSQDGSHVAVFDGTAFAFHDTATAAVKARTETVIAPGGSVVFQGAAFNAAGTRFASLFLLPVPLPSRTVLAVWDAADGKRLSAASVTNPTVGGIAWWGDDHVFAADAAQSGGDVHAVRDGRKLATVRMALGVRKVAMTTPGDRLWYGFDASGTALGESAPRLGSAAGPKAGMPVTTLELTARGPRWR